MIREGADADQQLNGRPRQLAIDDEDFDEEELVNGGLLDEEIDYE